MGTGWEASRARCAVGTGRVVGALMVGVGGALRGEGPFLIEGEGDEGVGARLDRDFHFAPCGERCDLDPFDEALREEQGVFPSWVGR